MILPFLRGASVGFSVNLLTNAQKHAQLGVNRIQQAACHIGLINNLLYMGCALSGGAPASLTLRAACYLTPVLLHTVAYALPIQEYPLAKKMVLKLNAAFSPLCQLAVSVTAVACIHWGSVAFGATTLGFLALGVAQQCYCLPLIASRATHTLGLIGASWTRMIEGGWWYKCVGLVDIFSSCQRMHHYYYPPAAPVIAAHSDPITVPIHPSGLKPHLQALCADPVPPLVGQFNSDIFSKILTQNDPLLYKLVEDDEHWTEFFADQKSPAEQRAYVEKGMQQFVDTVLHKLASSHEITDPTALVARVAYIASHLETLPAREQFTHCVRLALASYYCPARYLDEVRAVYCAVADSIEQDTLPARLRRVIQAGYRHQFQSFLHALLIDRSEQGLFHREKTGLNTFYDHLLDPHDLHSYNLFLNFLGEEFGLPEINEAQGDLLSSIDVVTKIGLRAIYRPLVTRFRAYCPETKSSVMVQEGIDSGQIPFYLVDTWFIDEYMSTLTRGTPEEKRQEATSWVHQNVYDLDTGKVRTPYMHYLLVKMGLLIKTAP